MCQIYAWHFFSSGVTVMDDFKDIDELREEVEFLQGVSKSQKKEIERLKQENALAVKNIKIVRSKLSKQVLDLRDELKTVKNKYERLKNTSARNPRGAGRKSMDDLWREKIEECWKEGLKDKEIYGWITCMDKKGRFLVLSESTYYRLKRKYYEDFKINFDSNKGSS